MPKATLKERNYEPESQQKERNLKNQSRNKWKSKEAIAKINKTKIWFLQKINKFDKPLARLIKNKGRKIKSTELAVNMERSQQTTEIERILRDYYQQLYARKMDNLEEMDKFLEEYNFSKVNQEAIENLNRPITSMEIETVI